MERLADISMFESLGNWDMPRSEMSMFNDGAAVSKLSGAFQSAVVGNMSPKSKNTPPFRGFSFSVYVDEEQHGGRTEPMHVHVYTPEGKAKFWLEYNGQAVVELAENNGIPAPIVSDIKKHIKKNRNGFVKDWQDEQARQQLLRED